MKDVLSYKQRARITADLFEAGVQIMRNNLRRRYPNAGDTEIGRMLLDWLRRKDDPIPGDVAGPVRVRRTTV